uniref:Rho GTPase activating protein 25 n=1 Tax=Piliocolobus tephrosceles TaxID=591936 RepID=A0A8C9HC77_9PRIM
MSLKLPRNWDFNLKVEAAKIARSRSVMTGEQMAAFHPSSTPNPLERPIKMGWLKKQRSIVKNWQQRYFVLRAQQLYYYKDEEDTKPQGCMHLPGSTIKEIATNPEEAGKFVFEIIPASWDQNRMGQDSYVLMASSQAEMEEWVKFLRRVAGTPCGAVFGQRLDETVAYEQKFGPHLVPILVEKCAEFILEHGRNEEGIFRLPGQDNLVKQLRDAFDAGERPSFDRDTDVHTVASLLKLYLRDLPEPVVPWSQYEGFLLCGQLTNADEAKTCISQLYSTSASLKVSASVAMHAYTQGPRSFSLVKTWQRWQLEGAQQELMKQLSILPRDNYSLLSYICRFLHEIQLNCAVNKMSVDNLATVIGVNLIRSKVEDPAVIMRGTPQIQRVMTMMIRDHEVLFPKSKDIPLSPPAQKNDPKKAPVARSSVGWDATEDLRISRTDSFSSVTSDSDITSPTGQQPSDGFPEDSSKVPREKPGDWKMQPRKRTQTLPNRKCFLTSAFQGSPREEASALSSQACDSKGDTLASPNSETGPGKKNSGEEELDSLQRMVQELRKEIETQKQMYEEQIKNLEKENYDVWAKVVRLNEELEKEKKKFAALEISLRNMERSREDVEKRNKALEEEVKEFVKSMKEPKTEA